MNQKEISRLAVEQLLCAFPFLSNYMKIIKDSIEIKFPSPNNNCNLWVSSYDKEITIGLSDKHSDWHTHMSLWNATDIKEEIHIAIELINNIFTGKEKIAISSKKGHYLTSNFDYELEYKEKDEIIEYKTWDEI